MLPVRGRGLRLQEPKKKYEIKTLTEQKSSYNELEHLVDLNLKSEINITRTFFLDIHHGIMGYVVQ